MSKLKVITLFSGIGAQEAGLKRLGVDFEMVGMCEIDKYAIKSYESINGPTHNYGDISKIDRLDYADLLVYSSPCVDFSLAGKQAGLIDTDGKQTRSGLLLEVGRLLMKMSDEGILPKYLLMENVKNLVGKKFKPAFDIWLKALEAIGYNNYWKVLNAKDYGVPQNRERVFVVSIRKDVDKRGYAFPEPFKLKRRLKDVLETNVDEKFYLSQKLVEGFLRKLERRQDKFGEINIQDVNKVCSTITARIHKCSATDPYIAQKHLYDLDDGPSIVQNPHGFNNGGIIKDNVAPTMASNGSYHLNNFVCNEPLIAASRGRNSDNPLSQEAGLPTEQMLEINQSGCSNTLTTVAKDNLVVEPNVLVQKRTEYGKMIRKDYEAGIIRESRHNMTELSPRTDGICNTIITVQKDNYLCEPKITVLGNYKPSGYECGRVMEVDGGSPTIKDNHEAVYSIAEPQIKQVGNCFPTKTRDNPNQGRVYDADGLSPALNCMGGGNREPLIIQNPHGYNNGGVKDIAPALTSGGNYTQNNFVIGSTQKNAYVGSLDDHPHCLTEVMGMGGGQIPMISVQPIVVSDCDRNYERKTDTSTCLMVRDYKGFGHQAQTAVLEVGNKERNETSIRIRKLTPKECWRLMDFTDEEFEAAQNAGVSKTQLYKQAGNSIVVSCLAHIFRELLKDTEYEPEEGFKTDWLERLKGN